MAAKKVFYLFLFAIVCQVESADLLETSYNYFMGISKTIGTFVDCIYSPDPFACAKDRTGKLLDSFSADVKNERENWQAEADKEAATSGRELQELPSKMGKEIEAALGNLYMIVHESLMKSQFFSQARKHGGGGIDAITISTSDGHKKKMKKKQKPAKIHLIHPVMMKMKERNEDKGGNNDVFEARADDLATDIDVDDAMAMGRGFLDEIWPVADKTLDAVAEHALESDNTENGIVEKVSEQEQRGKKKKKKKAILKLLILGAVLKAKIGTLLQILSFKLQVKFFLIALAGLGINLARFWLDLKKQHQQPQKVIYYEHAQHQHHYEHEDEHEHGWGPWSRSMDPQEEDVEIDLDVQNTPYRAHVDRNIRPFPTRN